MVNHIDDSRERPESAVSDDSGGHGQEPGRAIAEKGKGHAEHDTTSKDLADDKEDNSSRGDTRRQDTRADDSRERPESAVSDDRNSQDFTGR